MTNKMNAKDTVTASLAECFITIGKNRYNFMQLINFESKVNIKITDVPILGRTGKGHKPTGWDGEWKGTAHYNQSIMRDLMLKFKDYSTVEYFDIQVTNEDPTSSVGRQTIVHRNCLIDGGILSKFDADGENLDEDISGTFDDFDMPEKFTLLEGMQ